MTNPIIRNYENSKREDRNPPQRELDRATRWRENILHPHYATSWYYATEAEKLEAVAYLTAIIVREKEES